MAYITSEQIRDLSVAAVEDFLKRKVPLSEGIAKQAAAIELNSEQIQRAVEATNSIAYLKILSLSDDRTVEFPLAKYAEVMAHVVAPSVEKQAFSKDIEKKASAEEPQDASTEFSLNEKFNFLIKEAAANKAAIENLEIESINLQERLIKTASSIKKDEAWMDKLSCVTTPEEFGPLSLLVSGEVKEYRGLKELGLFKEAQLNEYAQFAGLYKQARQLVREMVQRKELQKRAEEVSRAQRTLFKNPINSVASGLGKGMGRVVGEVAAVPGRAASAVGAGIKGSFKKNLASMTNGNKASTGVKIRAAKSTLSSVAGKVGLVGGAALDAAFYNPGKDSSTGRSNDVWDALQRD